MISPDVTVVRRTTIACWKGEVRACRQPSVESRNTSAPEPTRDGACGRVMGGPNRRLHGSCRLLMYSLEGAGGDVVGRRGCFGAVSEEADGAREPAMRMTSGRARGPPGFRSGEGRQDLERLVGSGGGENLAVRSDTLPRVG